MKRTKLAANAAEKKLLSFYPSISQCLPHEHIRYLQNCVGTDIFLWLANGDGFWFKYVKDDKRYLVGAMLRDGYWNNARIDRMKILRYY